MVKKGEMEGNKNYPPRGTFMRGERFCDLRKNDKLVAV